MRHGKVAWRKKFACQVCGAENDVDKERIESLGAPDQDPVYEFACTTCYRFNRLDAAALPPHVKAYADCRLLHSGCNRVNVTFN